MTEQHSAPVQPADNAAIPAGSPIWVDYSAPDFARQQDFYEALFGWTFEDQGEDFGHYRMIRKDGATVGGAMDADQMTEQTGEQAPPPAWTVYLKTDDIDATMALVSEHGGAVMVEPMDVGPLGRMAIVASAGGEVLGFWQPGEFGGHDLPLTPGTSVWFEVMSKDFAADAAFYRAVAGWDVVPMGPDGGPDTPESGDAAAEAQAEDAGEMPAYATNWAYERSTAGLCDAAQWLPDEVPGHWRVYFQTADMDASVKVIEERGGRVVDGPMDSPFGVVATVLDPAGATFQLNQPPTRG